MKRDPAKLSDWRKRSKGLRRGKGLTRGKRINPVNKARKAKAFARNFGDRGEYIREMCCLADSAKHGSPCSGPIQAAHVIARGMGGCKGDRRHLVPLCAIHHLEAGENRTSQREAFEAKYGIDLLAEAERIASLLDEKGIP